MSKKTILLVDDDKTNLSVGKNALSDFYNVFTLNSGERLLKMLEKMIPDLILLDVKMPEMDGYETISRLKENPKSADIPVIFLTSLIDDVEEVKGLSMGAVDYITKPFSTPRLLKRLEVHLLVEKQKKELVNYSHNLEDMVAEKTKEVVNLKNVVLETMAELVDERDDVTGGHVDRTKRYIKVIINAMKEQNIYAEEMENYDESLLLQSSLLHDLGKIAVKDAILSKPGPLSDDEFEIIKTHPIYGEKIINKIKSKTNDSEFLENARVFAVSHHEKWDGTGYPNGKKGEEIPLLGRIMAIADVYDALVSERPYKNAFSHEKAMEIILSGKGTHFDPILTDLVFKISEKFKEIAAAIKE